MDIYTTLDLFTGYGGFQLGLRLAYPDVRFQTVAYVEIEEYAQRVIRARIDDGHLDDAAIWDDVKSFDGREWRGLVDIVMAGFPCQPHSVAGLRKTAKGITDDRDLWGDTCRIISEVRPRAVILENVPGILVPGDGRPPYAGRVCGDLAALSFDIRADVVSAASAGAPHKRNRWWCLGLAHADGKRYRGRGCPERGTGERLVQP